MASVALIQCPDYEPANVEAAVRRAVEHLGGMRSYVWPGQRVLLKPNLVVAKAPDRAVCTHPQVIVAVAELCKEAGAAEVMVGDSPGFGTARGALKKLGVLDQLTAMGVKVTEFQEAVEVHQSERPFPTFSVAREVLEADVVINLPKVKTHGQMVLTLATKNMYGALIGMAKSNWHLKVGHDRDRFALLVLEIARAVRPTLSIVDGVVGMEGNGPGNGDPRPWGAILAGDDTIAIDRVIADLLGVQADVVPMLVQAAGKDFGEWDLAKIQIQGDDPAHFRVKNWVLPPTVGLVPRWLEPLKAPLNQALNSHPIIAGSTCTLCSVCINHCPPHAMRMEEQEGKEHVAIDLKQCIHCFCCQELCPEGAITIRPGWMVRMGRAWRNQ